MIPPPVPLRGRRKPIAAIAAAVAIGGSWYGLTSTSVPISSRSPTPPVSEAIASVATMDQGHRIAALDNSLRAIEDADHTVARDRWDPKYVVETVGREPKDLFAWVRDSTTWIPYRGQLRGPTGVLMDRLGNSLDRALLLAALLEASGQTVRLARAELSREQATDLLPSLVPDGSRDSSPILDAPPRVTKVVAAKYGLDDPGIEKTLETLDSAATVFHTELERRTHQQSERLLSQVARPDPRPEWLARFDRAVHALRDHWWVQRREGDVWLNLDLLATGDTLSPAQIVAVGELPDTLRHTVAVRVVSERWTGGALSEQRVLQHVLHPAELYGRSIVLSVWPAEWPAQLHSDPGSRYGLRGAALDQHRWGVALLVDKDPVAQATIRDDAEADGPSRGGFGALGEGIAGAVRPAPASPESRASDPELTATWIEYELRAPGEAPRLVRRAVFDLLGPTARAAVPVQLVMDDTRRLMRSLALMLRTEMLPVSADIPAEYVLHLAARSIVGNGAVLRLIAAADGSRVPEPDSLLARADAVPTSLYSLAAARLAWGPVPDRVQVDRLGLLTRHRHPAVAVGGFGVRGAVDVVAGEVGVSLAEPDAFTARLRQGVFDTNVEAMWWNGISVLNAGEAYREPEHWVALTSSQRDGLQALRLPSDVRTRITQDLDAGLMVIAPSEPVPNGAEHFTGWWRIDPVSGLTRGIGGQGWGQCQAEYVNLVATGILRGGASFAFEYGLCQGISQGINEIKRQAADIQARGVWFQWTGSIQAKGAAEVFRESHEGCLVSAIMSGVLATVPIILKIRQLYKLRAARAVPYRPPLPRLPSAPRGPPPKYVQEAKQAFDQAERRRHAASDLLSRYSKQPNANRGMLRELEEAYKARQREAVDAFTDLQDARREAGRLPPTPPPLPTGPRGPTPISELNREYAEELLYFGFGGLLKR